MDIETMVVRQLLAVDKAALEWMADAKVLSGGVRWAEEHEVGDVAIFMRGLAVVERSSRRRLLDLLGAEETLHALTCAEGSPSIQRRLGVDGAVIVLQGVSMSGVLEALSSTEEQKDAQ